MGGDARVANGGISEIPALVANWVRLPAPAPIVHFSSSLKRMMNVKWNQNKFLKSQLRN
jgi:hypothetical protein